MAPNMFSKKCDNIASIMRSCQRENPDRQQMRSLSETCHGGRMKICKIEGDRKQCAQMASMGVRAGEVIDLICPKRGSSCIFKLHGGTISLDDETTKTIYVTPVL